MTNRGHRRVVYLCFLVSGAAGLIYEVVWARQLTLFLGITSHAHTAVITAFLAGLAAGAVVIGGVADRRRDRLRLYAWIEAGVALYGASTPWLFSSLETLYAAMSASLGIAGTAAHLLRFVLALSALLVPTFLMGGTLPLLVRGFVDEEPRLAHVLGRLYGINTLGAALGTFAAGYLLLPAVGVRRTVFFAAFLNLGVAVVVLWLRSRRAAASRKENQAPRKKKKARRRKKIKAPPKVPASQDPRSAGLTASMARVLLTCFAFSGLAALVYQIAWIRALTLVIGSSVYALSATLAVFLAGLAVGSLLYARYLAPGEAPRAAGRRLAQAAVLEAAVAFSALLGLPLIGRLPEWFLWGFGTGLDKSFALFQLFTFGLCFLIVFLTTLLLGALFPLLTALSAHGAQGSGRAVGTAYAANTAGTILGALLGGLLLLPALGIHSSVVLASAVHVSLGVVLWSMAGGFARARQATGTVVTLALFALLAWAIPPWDRALMTSGVFYRPERFLDRPPGQSLREAVDDFELLHYGEGRDGTVAVMTSGRDKILVINGKTDASNLIDLPTQVMLGQLPVLMHPEPRDVLILGLGTGITTHSVSTHPSPQHISVLEISPEVVAASAFFADENGNVLTDPRVDLVLGDARNTLLADRRAYDVIVSQPSNPWISGISNLFTLEFFELAHSRLSPGGIMAQWFHTYSMSTADLKCVIRTFQAAFRHVTLWIPHRGDLILLGSARPHALDFTRLEAAFARATVRDDWARGGVASPRQLMQKYLLGGGELAEFTAGTLLNTDDRPYIEFNAPRNLYAETSMRNLRAIVRQRDGRLLEAPVAGLVTATPDGFQAPAMRLEIRTAGKPAGGSWQAHWLVMMTEGADDQFGVGSQRTLTWRDGTVETRVQAAEVTAVPTPEELSAYLGSQLQDRAMRSGPVELPGGRQGFWGARVDASGELDLAMVWTCSFPSGELTRYIVHRRQPDPGASGPRSAALDLAGRFHCQ